MFYILLLFAIGLYIGWNKDDIFKDKKDKNN